MNTIEQKVEVDLVLVLVDLVLLLVDLVLLVENVQLLVDHVLEVDLVQHEVHQQQLFSLQGRFFFCCLWLLLAAEAVRDAPLATCSRQ